MKTSNLQHATVLLDEAVTALNIKPEGIYVDCTFGRGGHSRKILEKLGANGRLIATDKDLAAMEVAKKIVDSRFDFYHSEFENLSQVLSKAGVTSVNGILLDLGVSSPQIDDASRGFSFRNDGPLDMRMNSTQKMTAADWLANASEQEIAKVIQTYGEERFAKQIAKKIVESRAQSAITTTSQLSKIVASVVFTREAGQNPATRTFQAIRIFINRELEELSLVLPQAIEALAATGRLVVISFHSLEDRIVKRFMRHESTADHLPRDIPIRANDIETAHLKVIGKPVYASLAEVNINPRARSAVMRVAEKVMS
jgi:16S rRNA (cytosine1402-N4)-methyltransferase